MKKLIYVFLISMMPVGFMNCENKSDKSTASNGIYDPEAANEPVKETPKPSGTTTMEFDNVKYNFGTLTEGELATHKYKFKNTGQHPLVISDAKGSCGCTVPDYPKDAILPGGEGEIKVQFNSAGKEGMQSKTVTLIANTDPSTTILTIEGEVKKK